MNIVFERFDLAYPKSYIKLRCQVEVTPREIDFIRAHKLADDELYCFHDVRRENAKVKSANVSGIITGILTHLLFSDEPDEKARKLKQQSDRRQKNLQHASVSSDQSVTMRTLVKGHEFIASPFEIDELEDNLAEVLEAFEVRLHRSISKQQKPVKIIRGRK